MQLRSGNVELRAFAPSLTEVVYAVRNHPSVRAHLRDPRPIERESHQRWVEENLVRNRNLHLFAVFRNAEPTGIALLRNFRGNDAEIGLMMVEAQRQRLAAYVAAHLTAYYAFEVLGLERLLSYVPVGNAGALQFNRRCGFEPIAADATYQVLALSAERYRSHPTHRRFLRTRSITVGSSKE